MPRFGLRAHFTFTLVHLFTHFTVQLRRLPGSLRSPFVPITALVTRSTRIIRLQLVPFVTTGHYMGFVITLILPTLRWLPVV